MLKFERNCMMFDVMDGLCTMNVKSGDVMLCEALNLLI
jgi:hypothetical protein